jgi:hypothetical protein
MTDKPQALEHLLDLHGADLACWPDPAAAQEARTTALRDPSFRRKLDAAKRIDATFDRLSNAIGNDEATGSRFATVEATVLQQIEAQAERRRMFSAPVLARLAASALIACAVGVGVEDWLPNQTVGKTEAYDQLLLGSADEQTEQGPVGEG